MDKLNCRQPLPNIPHCRQCSRPTVVGSSSSHIVVTNALIAIETANGPRQGQHSFQANGSFIKDVRMEGKGGYGPMRKKADKGEGGLIFNNILWGDVLYRWLYKRSGYGMVCCAR